MTSETSPVPSQKPAIARTVDAVTPKSSSSGGILWVSLVNTIAKNVAVIMHVVPKNAILLNSSFNERQEVQSQSILINKTLRKSDTWLIG